MGSTHQVSLQLTPQRTIISARIFQNKKGQFYPENDPKSCFPDLATFVDEVKRILLS